MERPVGDRFKLNGCVYVVVKDIPLSRESGCIKCAFSPGYCFGLVDVRGYCSRGVRRDMNDVHFEHFGVDF